MRDSISSDAILSLDSEARYTDIDVFFKIHRALSQDFLGKLTSILGRFGQITKQAFKPVGDNYHKYSNITMQTLYGKVDLVFGMDVQIFDYTINCLAMDLDGKLSSRCTLVTVESILKHIRGHHVNGYRSSGQNGEKTLLVDLLQIYIYIHANEHSGRNCAGD